MNAQPNSLFLLCLFMMGGCISPASIVHEAAQAAQQDDLDRYVACFTPRSQSLLRVLYTNAGENRPELAILGAQEVKVISQKRLTPGVDNRRRTLLTIKEDTRTLPLVLHLVGGRWRIDLIDAEYVLTGLGTPF